MTAAIQPTPPALASPMHPLREHNYRLLWMGNSISWLGDQFYVVAMPWLILQLTGSAAALGAIMMTAAIPRAVLMLIGGAMTDRISARRIMIATAWLRTLLVAAIAVLVWFNLLQLWHVYVLAFAFGAADAFYSPAAQTFLPSLVKPEQLPAANSVLQSTFQITTLVGPAPAGILAKALGMAWAFIIDAISFLFIIGALWRLPDPPQAQLKRKNVWASVVEGVGYVGSDTALRSLLLVIAMINFCVTGPMTVSLAWIAKQRFGSPVAFAVLTTSLAGGSLLGVIIAGLRQQQRKRGWLLLGVSSFIGLSIGLMGILHYLWLMAVLLLLMAMAAGFLNIRLISWCQQRVERAVLGRVMSVMMFASIGLMPLSLASAGLALKWSLPGMFAVSGTLVLLVTTFAAAHRPVREIE